MDPGGRGRAGFRRGLDAGLVVGAVFALVEVLFVFVPGVAPAVDAVPIAIANVLLWTLVAGSVEAGRQTLNRLAGLAIQSSAAALVTITMLFVSRRGGFGSGAAANLPESVIPVLLLLALWWALRRRIAGPLGLAGIALVGLGATHGLLLTRAWPSLGSLAAWLSFALMAAGLLLATARTSLGSKRVAIGFLLAAFAAATGLEWRPSPARDETRRIGSVSAPPGSQNLVLIVMDTVRKDALGLYGYAKPTTPRLEELAHRAMVFEHAYASSPYTLSSHASLFSGLLPSVHGARPVLRANNAGERESTRVEDLAIDDRQPMFAEKLREVGYRTGLVSANSGYVSESFGMGRGFEYFNSQAPRNPRFHPWAFTLSMRLPSRFGSGSWFRAKKTASQVTEAAFEWLTRPDDRPFFLFLNYFDAHDPYHPPAPFDLEFSMTQTWGNYFRYGGKAPYTLSPSGLDFARTQYDAGIAAIDREVGRLWDSLRKSGQDTNTILIVTSDHGEFWGEHGRFFHGQTLYEEVLSIPLLVRAPGLSATVRPSYRFGIHQIPDLALALIRGGEAPEVLAAHLALSEPAVLAEFWHKAPEHGPPAVRAIYWDRYKLIQASDGSDELYDLAADPRESKNLLGAPTETLTAVRYRMVAGLPEMVVTPPPRKARAIDPETEERLRALGYIR